MRTIYLIGLIGILFTNLAGAQGGAWTWMRGDGNTSLSAGNYGILGVAAATNEPPARYNPSHWQDTSGKFWIFGGFRNNGANFTDLWRYDPNTNLWTWVKGPQNGSGVAGTFGTQGVAAPANNPPGNSLTSVTWTDTSNNLWLYHKFGDLWKYNILTNQWTWMKGSGVAGQAPVWGVQGIPSPLNTPGSNIENKASWTDSANNLWLYNKGNMWRYSIATNEWTWMKGTGSLPVPVFGTMNVPSAVVQPEQEDSYTAWKDLQGNFYLGINGYPGTSSTLWKYHIAINQWSWQSGDSSVVATTQNRKFISQCVASSDRNPGVRLEARGSNYANNTLCSGDTLFWFFGGIHSISGVGSSNNDLWIYNRVSNTWKWVSGDSTLNTAGNYGTQGIPSVNNVPYGMYGSALWVDKNQQVWVWGGKSDVAVNNNNMWRFTPDTNCISWSGSSMATITPPVDTSICLGDSTLMNINPNQNYVITPNTGYSINSTNTIITFYPSDTTTYTISATSNLSCTLPNTKQFTINVLKFPLYNPPPNDTICAGSNTVLSINSPPASLQFLWLPMNTIGSSVNVNPNATSTYTVIAQWPLSGCDNDTNTVTIHTTTLSWQTIITDSVDCFGGNNGSLTATVNGLGVINFNRQPGNINNTTGVFQTLTAGSYTITASDAFGCSITTVINLAQPTSLVQNLFSLNNPSCSNNDGAATITYQGGTGAITYTLLPNGISNSSGSFNGLSQGSYTVVATDAKSCTVTTAFALGIINGVNLISVNTTPTGCAGLTTGTATGLATGGAIPLQYSIGGAYTVSNVFSNLGSGTYTMMVMDTNGCKDSLVFTIITKNPPTISAVNITQPQCYNESDGVIQCLAFGDTSIVNYQLQPGSINQTNGNFVNLNSGTYTITVTDAGGCSKTTLALLITPAPIVINNPIVTDIICQLNNLGKVQATAIGGAPPLTYTLRPTGISNSTGLFENLFAGQYEIIVTDANNCRKGDSVEIKRYDCCLDLDLPNAFTPNGDELNERFLILNPEQIEVIKFVVANRWGNLVYISTKLDGWDGTIDGGDAAADTYYYFVKYRCKLDGKEYIKKGDVLLMR